MPPRRAAFRGLPDRIARPCRILLVGINPGLKSALVGHHYAGASNRFWKLMHASGLTPRRFHWSEDSELPGLGMGLTNLAARPTRGADELEEEDFRRGRSVLERKIRRVRPDWVAFVGVMVFRQFAGEKGRVACGPRAERVGTSRLFVLPNPSGRNANFTPGQMLLHFRRLKEMAL